MNTFASALVLLLVAAVAVDAVGRTQSASVRGRLMCKGRPAGGLTIKLYDHDTFTPDDQMARGVTSGDGSFQIAGHKSELLAVRPDLKIYHKWYVNFLNLLIRMCIVVDTSSPNATRSAFHQTLSHQEKAQAKRTMLAASTWTV
ncbi:Ttr-18 [Aphelenchoides besseyi]|nr:Ttr-18 [Aphelenchoides besseyi]KAI6211356.1 Ttr-18 [Aphelenchoides besseyi]